MTTREEKKAQVKARIYEAAIDLFCEQGYEATSLINIAEEAQVSTRTLYKYYPTKDAILRQFTSENIMAAMKYARQLPDSMPLMEKVIAVMTYDYEQMFCLFDMSFILHAVDEHNEERDPFELRNFAVTETIYYYLISDWQLDHGVQPGISTRLAATILMGQYRHVCDIYRFSHHGRFDERSYRRMLLCRIEAIWPSIEATMLKEMDDTYDDVLEPLPADDAFLTKYAEAVPFRWERDARKAMFD